MERIAPRRWIPVRDGSPDPAPSRDERGAARGTYPLPRPAVASESHKPVEIDQHFDHGSKRGASASRAEHYAARAAEARQFAKAAADHSIEQIHLEMALRYDLLARLEVDEPQPLHMVR